ncbi:hypothetical protein P7C73_g6223, partial [Tremellales sp. Uapishka_1]
MRIAIIGAGPSGISMGLALKAKGFEDFTIYDREDGVGVVAVANWQNLAQSQNLRAHIKLRHTFLGGMWQESTSNYLLGFSTPDKPELMLEADIIISAVAGFSVPHIPNIPGLDGFTGSGGVIHSARWPKDLKLEDLKGKRVVVVGNACTGFVLFVQQDCESWLKSEGRVQLVTALASVPEIHVTAMARSAHWLVPTQVSPCFIVLLPHTDLLASAPITHQSSSNRIQFGSSCSPTFQGYWSWLGS